MGFEAIAISASDESGRWLARMAALETASVPAFETLEAELREHRAPGRLIVAAERSAKDERRHAAIIGQLARGYGATAGPFVGRSEPVRTIEEIATENMIEGRVREAFGALVAAFQATSAGDPIARAAFAAVAPDELFHAQLADAVDQWARSLLPIVARRRVEEAGHEACGKLSQELVNEPEPMLRKFLGFPDATRAQELIGLLAEELRRS